MHPFVGRVLTVLGPLDPASLGPTMTHEHLFFRRVARAPLDPLLADQGLEPLNPENLWWVRRYPGWSQDNKRLDDFEAVRGELAHFVADGGRTIVDVTTRGISPDPAALRRLAEATGVSIIAGTGYYQAITRPPAFAEKTVEEIAQELTQDVMVGFAETDICAGIIGELAIEGPGPRPGVRSISELDPGDVKLLRAAARAQRASGAAISLHPPASRIRGIGASPVIHGILDLLEGEGADPQRVVVGHLDRDTFETVASLASLAARGVSLAFDQWGYEGYITEVPRAPRGSIRPTMTGSA